MRENNQRLLENSRAKRERSRLNMASRLHLAMGEAGAGPKERKNVRKTQRENIEKMTGLQAVEKEVCELEGV